MPSTGSSVVSSRQSDRSSPSDNESIATTVSSGPEKTSSRQAKPSSRKRKLSLPVPVATPPCHATVMSALREKLSARSPGSASQSLPSSSSQPPTKRQRAISNLSQQSVDTAPSPRLLPQEDSASRRLYALPLSQGFAPLQAAAGPTESEKFRASLNLLNIAAERDSMRETLAGTSWQTSDVRGE